MKVKISQYAKMHNVTIRTVWNWIKKGEVIIERTPTGRNMVVIDNDKKNKISSYVLDNIPFEFCGQSEQSKILFQG